MTDKIESARAELESICGPGHALVAADAKARYLRDWRGEVEAKAIAVARPANADQVAAVVRFCARAGLAIVPQGGNTGMCAGATPHPLRPDCVVVALERMRAIRAIDAEERAATVEAGVVLETLQEAARARGLLFPLDLGARASCQIGGMLATNAGGVNTIRHGCARDLCLGIEAVMADGEIVDLLSTLRKDNTGYDLKNLLVGSEGTLAIITAATLRLRAEPRARVACCVAQKDAKAAMRLLSNLQAGDAAVEAFELIPRFSAALVGEHFPDLRRPFASPPPLCSLVDFSGEDESILRAAIETALAAAIESGDALDAAISNSESQRRDFWALREAIPLARARAGKWAQIDAALPVATIADFIAAVESKFAPRCEGQIALYGHAGDGNLHIGFRPLGKSPTENPTAAAAMRDEILEEIYRRGGSFSAEHGIGQTKTALLARRKNPAALRAMAAIKRALDPRGMMNPGKVFAPELLA